MNSIDELQDLLKELKTIKQQQKSLEQKEAQCKEDLMELLKENGIEKADSDYGSIRILRRINKDYGPSIEAMETELKEAKNLADDMGDYTVKSFKEIIVYNLPKEPTF